MDDNQAVNPESAPEQQSSQQEQTEQPETSGPEPESPEQQGEEPQPAPTTEETQGSAPQGKEYQKLRRRSQEAEARAVNYERENAELKARLAAIERAQNQQKVPDKQPDLVDYENEKDFHRDYAVWQEHQIREKIRKEDASRAFTAKAEEAAKRIPDFRQVIQSAQIPIAQELSAAIIESEIGPDIFYHLAKNPVEAYRLANMSPSAAAREIGKIEAKLAAVPPAPQKPKFTQAPEPVKPLETGRTDIEVDISKLSTDEYIARRNREIYGK